MAKIIAGVSLVLALLSTGIACALYLNPSLFIRPDHSEAHSPPPSLASMRGDRVHMTRAERAEFDQRQLNAARTIALATDWGLTGDAHGHAEWRPSEDDFFTTCGVTPDSRYLIARNEIGKSRYDEPLQGDKRSFTAAWNKAGCEATSPIHQGAILAAQERLSEAKARREEYDLSHPIDADCMIAEMKELSVGGAAAAKRQLADPDRCRSKTAVFP